MKKLVVINFDDMFINVSRILCQILNSLKQVKEKDIYIEEYDIGCDLEKPFPQLFYSVLEDFDVNIDEHDLLLLEEKFKDLLISNAILANGLQSFLHECKSKGIEVVVITNKPYQSVVDCVRYYTFNLVDKIILYKEGSDAIKLINKLQKDRKLTFSDLLIISSTDFNDDYLEPYEYSTTYCGEKVFDNYEDIICVLDDEDISFPYISLSLDIEISKNNFDNVYNLVKEHCNQIDYIECENSDNNIIIINPLETRCEQNDGETMMIENIMEKCISPFYCKKDIIHQIQKEYDGKFFLSCAIYLETTKINPFISPTMKILKFLAENNIELNYDMYC